MHEILQSQRVRKGALFFYVFCLASLVFAYFVVSAMEIPTAAYVQGQDELVVGRPSALRGMIMNAQNGLNHRALHDSSLSLVSTESGVSFEVGRGLDIGPRGLFHVQITPPAEAEPGDYDLVLSVWVDPGSPRFDARAPVRLISAFDRARGGRRGGRRRPNEWWRQSAPERSSVSSRVMGQCVSISSRRSRPLARGLPNTISIRTTDRGTGEPLACEVIFEGIEGRTEGAALPSSVRTNAAGLSSVTFSPSTTHRWSLGTSCLAPSQEEASEEPEPHNTPTDEPSVIMESEAHLDRTPPTRYGGDTARARARDSSPRART